MASLFEVTTKVRSIEREETSFKFMNSGILDNSIPAKHSKGNTTDDSDSEIV